MTDPPGPENAFVREGRPPDVTVVVVNWNTRDLLARCLDAVHRTVLPPLCRETIVVDNGSRDGSASFVRERHPEIVLIENDRNLGFAAANNQALRIMRGRYALLLNTDAVLTDGAARKLVDFADRRPEAAMVCGQLLNADGSLQNSVAAFPSPWVLLANTSLLEYLFPRRYPSKRYRHEAPIRVDSAVGACLLVRREAMGDAGLLDERYFFFFEETDWAYRMRQRGWEVWQVPDAFVYHLQGQSIGREIPSRIAFYRARDQFLRKWLSRPAYLFMAGVVFLRLIVNWSLTTAGCVLTLCAIRSLRRKWRIYSGLLAWRLGLYPSESRRRDH